MTGVWSLGSEMLRNVESFWCPIRYYEGKKCANCAVDFPDIDHGWVKPDSTMSEVVAKMEEMYGDGRREWFGHPAIDRQRNADRRPRDEAAAIVGIPVTPYNRAMTVASDIEVSPAPSPPPWRLGWLTPARCRIILAIVLLFDVVGHVRYLNHNCPIDLSGDEAQYWDWSRKLDWSYYSKGPLVAYIIRASSAIFGDTMRACATRRSCSRSARRSSPTC